LQDTWDNIKGVFGALLGGITWLAAGRPLNAAINSGGKSKLATSVKDVMSPWFDRSLLNQVELRDHATLVAPPDKIALTSGYTVYWKGSFDQCDEVDMNVLMHELVHVRQYEDLGVVWFALEYAAETAQHGYDGNRFEKEAINFVAVYSPEMRKRMENECAIVIVQRAARRDGWFWLMWG